jgi:hypothetical protein
VLAVGQPGHARLGQSVLTRKIRRDSWHGWATTCLGAQIADSRLGRFREACRETAHGISLDAFEFAA